MAIQNISIDCDKIRAILGQQYKQEIKLHLPLWISLTMQKLKRAMCQFEKLFEEAIIKENLQDKIVKKSLEVNWEGTNSHRTNKKHQFEKIKTFKSKRNHHHRYSQCDHL